MYFMCAGQGGHGHPLTIHPFPASQFREDVRSALTGESRKSEHEFNSRARNDWLVKRFR